MKIFAFWFFYLFGIPVFCANFHEENSIDEETSLFNYKSNADLALQKGVEQNDLILVKKSLKKGANPRINMEETMYSVLRTACVEGKYEIAQALIEAGADVNEILIFEYESEDEEEEQIEYQSLLASTLLSGELRVAALLLSKDAVLHEKDPKRAIAMMQPAQKEKDNCCIS
jgi:hypothetical protein